MHTVRVREVLHDRILVGRESARLLEEALRAIMPVEKEPGQSPEATTVVIDFEGVEGIAPSSLDEFLCVFESMIAANATGRERCLIVANPPTRLSRKFEAVARGHGMTVQARADGSWLLTG